MTANEITPTEQSWDELLHAIQTCPGLTDSQRSFVIGVLEAERQTDAELRELLRDVPPDAWR